MSFAEHSRKDLYTSRRVSRLADWIAAGRGRGGARMFTSAAQIEGALMLAYQQYLDGMGRDAEDWIGIATEELATWRDTGTLPKRLRPRTAKR